MFAFPGDDLLLNCDEKHGLKMRSIQPRFLCHTLAYGLLPEALMTAVFEITIASVSHSLIYRISLSQEKTLAIAMQGWCCCVFCSILLKSNFHT